MKNLNEVLETMKLNDKLTVEYTIGDCLGRTYNYIIEKYNSDEGLNNFMIGKEGLHGIGSYNVAGITRGALNLYTFDIFNNSIKVRIKLKDLSLVSLERHTPKVDKA